VAAEASTVSAWAPGYLSRDGREDAVIIYRTGARRQALWWRFEGVKDVTGRSIHAMPKRQTLLSKGESPVINIINESVNPYYNLALEEYLLKEMGPGDDRFMLWQNSPAIIVGRNQNTWDEINLDFVRENNIAVVRRMTGGGAVYHDLGNLNFTFIARDRKGSTAALDFVRFAQPVIDALKELGAPAEFSGRNDIVVKGAKVSGNAQYRYKDLVLHHGTLLFDSRIEDMAQALNVSRDKIASKGVASVRSRVANIKEYLSRPITMADFRESLIASVARTCAGEFCTYDLNSEDIRRTEQLTRSKYETWDWNFGASPGFSLRKSERFGWGKVDVLLDIRDGLIAGCRIFGDFFGSDDISPLEGCLIGLPYQEDAIREALTRVNPEPYINGLDQESLLRLIIYGS
jgi:lipoate-protein ligase A